MATLDEINRKLDRLLELLDGDIILTQSQAAQLLGCTTHTIHNREKKGLIKKVCVNGHCGYSRNQLLKTI
jgi:hypothetical protein